MKKTFKYVMVALAMLSAGTVITSCEGEDNFLTQIINLLFNTGETYTYQGKATSLSLDGSTTEQGWVGNYINGNQPSSRSLQVSLKAGNTAEVAIPAFTDGKVTVNAITIYNLAMTASSDNSYTILDLGENSSIDGSIIYDGVTYSAANLHIYSAQVTSAAISLDMDIFFQGSNDGTDYSKCVKFTYTGTGIATN